MVPAKGGPKILKLKSSWHRRRRSKILAVSLKHWKGKTGGHPGGVYEDDGVGGQWTWVSNPALHCGALQLLWRGALGRDVLETRAAVHRRTRGGYPPWTPSPPSSGPTGP